MYRAVDTVASTLASLPFGIYERTADGSSPAKRHPLYNLVRLEPSPYQTSYTFRRALFTQACFGDAFAIIHRNGVGRATRLEMVDAYCVTTYQRDNGDWFYIVRRTVGTRYSEEVIFPADMIHLRGLSINGMTGVDVVSTFRDSFGMGIAATEYGASYYGNGAHTDKAVSFPGTLTPQQRALLESKINEKSGSKNAGKMMVLDGGMTISELSSDPGKAMLNEARKFQADEYARIFGVPAHLIGQLDRATFNNIETMNTQFVTLCLNPWAEQLEQEFAVKLLTSDEKVSDKYFFRINLDGLMRGDTQARAQYVDTMLKNMVYTINDVRQLDNLNTVPWGDTPFAQAGIAKLSEDGKIEMAEPETDGPPSTAQNNQDNGTGEPQASAND